MKGQGPAVAISCQVEGWRKEGCAGELIHVAFGGMRSEGTVVGRLEWMGTGVEEEETGKGSDGL